MKFLLSLALLVLTSGFTLKGMKKNTSSATTKSSDQNDSTKKLTFDEVMQGVITDSSISKGFYNYYTDVTITKKINAICHLIETMGLENPITEGIQVTLKNFEETFNIIATRISPENTSKGYLKLLQLADALEIKEGYKRKILSTRLEEIGSLTAKVAKPNTNPY